MNNTIKALLEERVGIHRGRLGDDGDGRIDSAFSGTLRLKQVEVAAGDGQPHAGVFEFVLLEREFERLDARLEDLPGGQA